MHNRTKRKHYRHDAEAKHDFSQVHPNNRNAHMTTANRRRMITNRSNRNMTDKDMFVRMVRAGVLRAEDIANVQKVS